MQKSGINNLKAGRRSKKQNTGALQDFSFSPLKKRDKNKNSRDCEKIKSIKIQMVLAILVLDKARLTFLSLCSRPTLKCDSDILDMRRPPTPFYFNKTKSHFFFFYLLLRQILFSTGRDQWAVLLLL